MRWMMLMAAWVLAGVGWTAPSAAAGAAGAAPGVARPYILWTREEAAAIRHRIQTQPWARQQFDATFKDTDPEARRIVDNLFLYSVMGDRSGVEVEKAPLVKFINCPPFLEDSLGWMWHHVDQSEQALRFDILHDELTVGERRRLESTFREHALHGIRLERIRGWDSYSRMASHHMCALATGDKRLMRGMFESEGGLKAYFDGLADGWFTGGGSNPGHKNLGALMLWCRGCERLGVDDMGFGYTTRAGVSVRRLLEGMAMAADPRTDVPGGAPFYTRSAMRDTVGMFGRGFRVPLTEALPHLAAAPLVLGRLPDGTGGWPRWSDRGSRDFGVYWTGESRMQLPLVFEIAHKRWPDAGFDYFLAQMRPAKDDRYYPSLYWGLEPIDPAKVKPPAVKSGAFVQRGQAILRAEEGPGFLESPAPAAVVQMATQLGRTGGDCLALHSFFAFNRPLYFYTPPRGDDQSPPAWTTSARSHNTVAVDNLHLADVRVERDRSTRMEKRPVWPRPIGAVPVRSSFDPLVKFVGIRARPRTVSTTQPGGKTITESQGIYPGVEAERCLLLTREYLLDVFRLTASQPRTFHWIIHALGEGRPDAPESWKPTKELDQALADPDPVYLFQEQRAMETGATWSVTALQTCATKDASLVRLGGPWYDRKIGVRISMLGEEKTTAYVARTPGTTGLRREVDRTRPTPEEDPRRLPSRTNKYDAGDRGEVEIEIPGPGQKPAPKAAATQPKPEEPSKPQLVLEPGKALETGGVSIIAARKGQETAFVALHEPFAGGAWKIEQFRRIAQTPTAVAVAVVGKDGSPANDRALLAWGDEAEKVTTLAGDGESFTFTGHAFVRISAESVQVSGQVKAMSVRVAGAPRLLINGVEQKAAVSGGVLSFQSK